MIVPVSRKPAATIDGTANAAGANIGAAIPNESIFTVKKLKIQELGGVATRVIVSDVGVDTDGVAFARIIAEVYLAANGFHESACPSDAQIFTQMFAQCTGATTATVVAEGEME